MRRLSETRLRDAERRAPAPFVPMTMVRHCVEPNGPGGCDGPPIEAGVFEVTRTRKNAPAIVRWFDPPRLDLLDVEWERLTDEQVMELR
jgi:hypothetical protein